MLVAALMLTAAAHATNYAVSNKNDSGSGSLRAAITSVNGDSSADTITFNAAVTGTISLQTPLPAIANSVTITGPGAGKLTISGSGISSGAAGPMITVNTGVTVTISGLNLTENANNPGNGGAISSGGTLTVSGCAITDNTASEGAGIYTSGGTLTVTDSTFYDNFGTTDGGAIAITGSTTATVTDSTFSTNTALGDNGGAIENDGTLTVTNSTISLNFASIGSGGGIDNGGTLTLGNSIVAGNSASSGADISGSYMDNGGNQVNESSTAINLAPLGNYGGVLQTMLPLPGSPAICGGSQSVATSAGLTTDERGFAFGQSSYCTAGTNVDAGAVQTDYTSIQFTNANTTYGYAGLVGQAVATPAAPIVSVTENGQNIGDVPLTLTEGSGTATGLGPVTTVAGTGAKFNAITVSSADASDTLTASLQPTSTATPMTQSVGLVIEQPPTLAGSLPGATVGTLYTQQLVSNGSSPFTDTVTSGSLPAGITFASDGSLTGTPTTANSNDNFSLTVTDNYGFKASGSYSVAVAKGTAQFSFSGTSQVYTGSSLPVTVTTTPAGLDVNVTYTGISPTVYATSTTAPKNVGSYTVDATVTGADANNWTGSSSTTLNITSGSLTITLGNLNQTFGSTSPVTVSTNPGSVTIDLSFKGTGSTTYGPSATQPTNAGTYQVTATVDPSETNYTGTPAQTATLTIAQEPVTLTLSNNLSQTFGSTSPVTVSTSVSGVTVDLSFQGINGTTYGPSATQPTSTGTYAVTATVDQATEPNYTGSTNGTLTIGKEAVTITLGNLNQTFGSTSAITVTSTPSETVDVTFTGVNGTSYGPSSTQPTNAGTYQVNAVLDSSVTANYSGSTSGVLTISKEAVTITLSSNLTQTFGSATAVTASSTPSVTLDLSFSGDGYGPSATQPVNAGTYTVTASVDPSETNFTGTISSQLQINKATATVTLTPSSLLQVYTGSPLSVAVTTTPAVQSVSVTYNGTTNPPVNPGTYSVIATVVDPNYQGSTTGQMVIENFSLSASFNGTASVTQGFATASGVTGVSADPFTPQTVTVTPTAVGYTPNLTLSCTVTATTAPSSPTLPTCLLNSSAASITGNGLSPATVTVDASTATPGTYSVAVEATDPATNLARTSTFTVNVRSASSPLTVQSGATTGNSATVSFVLPATVSVTGLSCNSIAGPTLTAPVTPIALGVACTLNPASIASATAIQDTPVTVTVNTGATITTAQLAGRKPGYLAAGVLGIPLLGLLGMLAGGKKSTAAMLRLFLIAGIALGAMQLSGCGGSFSRTTTASGSTPPGSYYILVQGTGSDTTTYQAVVELNVTR